MAVEWIVSTDPRLVEEQAIAFGNSYFASLVAGGLDEREATVNAYAAIAPMMVPVMLKAVLARLDEIDKSIARLDAVCDRLILRAK